MLKVKSAGAASFKPLAACFFFLPRVWAYSTLSAFWPPPNVCSGWGTFERTAWQYLNDTWVLFRCLWLFNLSSTVRKFEWRTQSIKDKNCPPMSTPWWSSRISLPQGAGGDDSIWERRQMFLVQTAINVAVVSILAHVDGCTYADIFQCGPRSVNSGSQHEHSLSTHTCSADMFPTAVPTVYSPLSRKPGLYLEQKNSPLKDHLRHLRSVISFHKKDQGKPLCWSLEFLKLTVNPSITSWGRR